MNSDMQCYGEQPFGKIYRNARGVPSEDPIARGVGSEVDGSDKGV